MTATFPKIVHDANNLCLLIFRLTSAIPKHYRPTLAQKLELMSMETYLSARSFVLSNTAAKTKSGTELASMIKNIDQIEAIIGIAHDLRAINDSMFGQVSQGAVDVRKQLHGLMKKYAAAN